MHRNYLDLSKVVNSKKKYIFVESVIVALFLFFVFLNYFDFSVLKVYMARDIQRAIELLAGKLIFYGPEASGGGNLPGSFFYWLLALFIKIGGSWESVWYGMMSLLAFSSGGLWYYCRSNLNFLASCFLIAFLFSNDSLFRTVLLFMNPSYLPIFILLQVSFLYKSFNIEESNRAKSWYIFSVVTGLSMQIHLLSIGFFIVGLLMQFLYRRNSIMRLPAKVFIVGTLLLISTMLPYFVLLSGATGDLPVEAGPHSNSFKWIYDAFMFFVSQSINSPSTIFYRFFSIFSPFAYLFLFTAFVVKYVTSKSDNMALEFSVWRRENSTLFLILLLSWMVFLGTGIMAIFANFAIRYSLFFVIINFLCLTHLLYFLIKNISEKRYIYCLGIVLFLSNCLYLYSTSTLDFRPIHKSQLYGPIVVLCVAVFFYILLRSIIEKVSLAKYILPGLLGISALVVPAFAVTSYSLESYIDFELADTINQIVIRRTGWTYDEFQKRFYSVRYNREISYRFTYESSYRALKNERISPFDKPDGFMIFNTQRDDQRIYSLENIGKFISSKMPNKTISQGVLNRDIEIDQVYNLPGGVLVSYIIKNKADYLPHFQNIGYPYGMSEVAERFLEYAGNESSAQFVGKDQLLLQWNLCNNLAVICSHGVVFNLPVDRSAHGAELTFFGKTSEQVSRWITPEWSPSYRGLRLRVKCLSDGSTTTRVIAARTGNMAKNKKIRAGAFLLPLVRNFDIKCSEESAVEIDFSWNWHLVKSFSFLEPTRSPGRHFTMRIKRKPEGWKLLSFSE